jgi:hypothetical protein
MSRVLFIAVCFIFLAASVKRTGSLPKSLKEISGWVFVNDTTLIAHNDSGNDAKLFVINLSGKILHQTTLKDVDNIDFEDITSDGLGHIYLADIGNNSNKRKNLVIYKLKTSKVLTEDEVTPKKITFSYPEQKQFPPAPNKMHFDAESIAYYKDSLYIFTKCRSVPFDGACQVYALPTTAGNYKAKWKYTMTTGKRDWYRDAVTGADFFKDELYLITYNRLMIYSFKKRKAVFKQQIAMNPISQKEAVAVRKNGWIYIADERQKVIGGGTIFVVKLTK